MLGTRGQFILSIKRGFAKSSSMQGSYKIVVVDEGGQPGKTCVITYDEPSEEQEAKEKDLEERMKKMERQARRQRIKRRQI